MSKIARNVFLVFGLVLLVILVVGLGVFVVFGHGLLAGYRVMGPGMMYRLGFPLGGGFSVLFLLLLIGGLIWLIALPGRQPTPPQDTPPTMEAPLDILKRRYAKGEITKEQYEQMKQDLGL